VTKPFGISRVRTIVITTSLGLLAACSGAAPGTEDVASTSQALTGGDAGDAGDAGTITISGTITDPIDGPQAGITVTLAGSADAQIVTNFGGSFSFAVRAGGSYSITAAGSDNYFSPPFHSCLTVTPSIVNLNNLTQSTNIQFVGSGTDSTLNCTPASSMGATTGSFTVKGTVTSGGQPVAGARVSLNGSLQGYRTTDETGAYSFEANSGSYSVSVSGACKSFAPSVVNLNNLATNATENFQGTSCPPAPLTFCPAFDADLGLSEPASCATVSTTSCAADRLATWAGEIASDYLFEETDELALNDCRFGKWQQAPIVNDFTFVGALEQQQENLSLFTLQLLGCALSGNIIGPLNLEGSLIPPDLIRAGLKFTTADISALEDEYVAAINQGLADFGAGPITSAQSTAIRGQLNYAAAQVPGAVASTSLSYSTCP
jgi:hypothetical protein